mgnify:CR=1 FL=1
MRDIIVLIMIFSIFIYGIFYNLKFRKTIKVFSSPSNLKKIISLLSVIIFFAIAYIAGGKPWFYIFSSIASIFFISTALTEGLSDEGIIFYTGGRGINNIKVLNFNNIRILKIRKDEKITLKAQGQGDFVDMKFQLEDEEKIMEVLRNKEVRIVFD